MSLIAVSGKIGSGKSTVAEIIQYLDSQKQGYKGSFQEWYTTSDRGLYPTTWQNKMFANKIKDIVCILLGCTRAELEDREFKERELGEEWDKYVVYIHGSHEDMIAGIYSDEESAKKDKIITFSHMNYYKRVSMTPRLLMQLLGTECGRNIIHPNIWVNALMNEYKSSCRCKRNNAGTCVESPNCSDWAFSEVEKPIGEDCNNRFPNWIISDMRFPNELKAIKDRSGITIRVNRDGCPKCKSDNIHVDRIDKSKYCNECNWIEGTHESETALDNATFDYVIDNNGTIEDLIEVVKQILIKESII